MATFAEQYAAERKKASQLSEGNPSKPSSSFAQQYTSSKEHQSLMADFWDRRKRDEEQRQQRLLDEQNNALRAFQERQRQITEGNIFTRGVSAVKETLGMGETLPEIQGSSQQYQEIRQSQLQEKEAKKDFSGRIKGAFESVKGAIRPYGEAGLALLKGSQAQYLPKEQQAEAAQQGADVLAGGAKMTGEILSGTAKYLVKKAEEISPTKNMGLMAQYSNVRKIPVIQDGQVVGEQLLDRNSPEYKAATGAWIDNVGILNYKPEYKNELEKTGGDIVEIGSWFIPITRLGKVAKLEQALASMPKIADLLGVVPKVVKVGGKFMYEISKDVADVAVLDAIRGKTDEEIFSDAQAAGYGSAALRAIIGLPGAGAKLKQIFAEGKVNKTATIVEDSVGKLSAGERTAVKELMTEGKPVDDIVENIITKRADEGKDIYTHAENIESGVVKVGEQKAAKAIPSTSTAEKVKTAETTIKTEPTTVPPVKEVPKSTEAPTAKPLTSESPIIKRLNENLDEAKRLNPELPTTNHSSQLVKAEKEILDNPEKIYNETVHGTAQIEDSLKTSRLALLLENAKAKNDQKAIAEIIQAAALHGRRAGQEVEMLKALIDKNPTNKALMDLAKAKLSGVETRFKKIDIKKGGDAIDEVSKILKNKSRSILKENRATNVAKARTLIKSLSC